MTNFIILYIAILLSLDIMFGDIIFLNLAIPFIALLITAISYGIAKLIKKPKTKAVFAYPTKETEEERKKRVNAEVDKIIEDIRNKN